MRGDYYTFSYLLFTVPESIFIPYLNYISPLFHIVICDYFVT